MNPKINTSDRALTHDRNLFYLTETIGAKRSTTPEGFLVCHDVPIARIGNQLYSDKELPLEGGPDGLIRVDRPPEEVFRPETIASFEGKPVTVEHPSEQVTPDNWKRLAVGFVQNVRRGEGIEDDLLIADLVITEADAIAYVNKDLPEVSCGYEADYEQKEPGRGVQRNIVGNHVALVERGRAGPRCSIQDGETDMTKKANEAKAPRRSFWDRLMTAVKAKDEEAVKAELEAKDEEMAEEGEKKPDEKTSDEGGGDMAARLDRIEAILAKLVPMEEQEHGTSLDSDEEKEEEETKDTVLEAETAQKNAQAQGQTFGDSMKAVVARAEILAPGISIPTGDAAKKAGAIAEVQRKALEAAHATADGKACVEPFLMGREIKALTGDALAMAFAGAAELMRSKNNAKTAARGSVTKDFGPAPRSVSEMNAQNRAFWANRTAR